MSDIIFFDIDMSQEEIEQSFSDDWRHFGVKYFRYDCPNCNYCTNVRINCDLFKYSKSQKRVIRKNKDLIVKSQLVRFNDENSKLLNAWQSNRKDERGWNMVEWDHDLFMNNLYLHDDVSRELAVYTPQGKLIAKTFYDDVPTAYNMAYSCYDPKYSSRSLGVFLVLTMMKMAFENNKKYVYLGHLNDKAKSLRYKRNFSGLEFYERNSKIWKNLDDWDGGEIIDLSELESFIKSLKLLDLPD